MDFFPRELEPFMDAQHRLTALPSKNRKKLAAIHYLAGKLEAGRCYTESEVNDILNDWALFHDPATLRREMYNKHLLDRSDDGHIYCRADTLPELAVFIAKYI